MELDYTQAFQIGRTVVSFTVRDTGFEKASSGFAAIPLMGPKAFIKSINKSKMQNIVANMSMLGGISATAPTDQLHCEDH